MVEDLGVVDRVQHGLFDPERQGDEAQGQQGMGTHQLPRAPKGRSDRAILDRDDRSDERPHGEDDDARDHEQGRAGERCQRQQHVRSDESPEWEYSPYFPNTQIGVSVEMRADDLVDDARVHDDTGHREDRSRGRGDRVADRAGDVIDDENGGDCIDGRDGPEDHERGSRDSPEPFAIGAQCGADHFQRAHHARSTRRAGRSMVGVEGLEPPTSAL